jgi:hypothetical protein
VQAVVSLPSFGGAVEGFDVVRELHVGLDEFAAGGDAAVRALLFLQGLVEAFPHARLRGTAQIRRQLIHRALRERFVGLLDGQLYGSASRLQTRVRLALAGAVDANERLKEVAVGELPGLGSTGPDGQRLLEGVADGGLVVRLDPAEDGGASPFESARRAALTTGPSMVSQCACAGREK